MRVGVLPTCGQQGLFCALGAETLVRRSIVHEEPSSSSADELMVTPIGRLGQASRNGPLGAAQAGFAAPVDRVRTRLQRAGVAIFAETRDASRGGFRAGIGRRRAQFGEDRTGAR